MLVRTKLREYTATEGVTPSGWMWDLNNANGKVAGWKSLGDPNRIKPGEAKIFTFATFDITGNDILPGFHIGPCGRDSGFFKGTLSKPNIVPEPSSLLIITTSLMGLIGYSKKLRK